MKEHSSTPDTIVGKSKYEKELGTDSCLERLYTCIHVFTMHTSFTFIALYSHRGIAWAPACGKAISELVLKGECSSVNLAPFDPSRFTPNAGRGGRGRKKKGASVGEQW
jgi:hypothetical protein